MKLKNSAYFFLSFFMAQAQASSAFEIAHFDIAQLDITQLTLPQKIGQLFMVAAVADEEIAHEIMERKTYRMDKEYIEELLAEDLAGGIIFLGKSNVQKQKQRTEHFQQRSRIPLLIGQDLEPGRVGASRFEDFKHLSNNQQLGSYDDTEETYQTGKSIGYYAQGLGVHIVFAPVADVHSNPNNPVINDRSFGNNPDLVARHSIAFAQGLNYTKTIGCAKHFPGHGDTNVDSHYDLPFLTHDKERLHTIELAPFKALIKENIPMIMVGHLEVPAFEDTKNLPSSLSKKIITDLLKKELGFDGIIITDALDMEGIIKHSPDAGQVAIKALQAGNDILLCPFDVPAAVASIKKAVENGEITEEEIDVHVEKILALKKIVCT
jgi:beta-N-acetylhexosaminidase